MPAQKFRARRGFAAACLIFLVGLISAHFFYSGLAAKTEDAASVYKPTSSPAHPALAMFNDPDLDSGEDVLLNITITDYVDGEIVHHGEYDADEWYADAHLQYAYSGLHKRVQPLYQYGPMQLCDIITLAQKGSFLNQLLMDTADLMNHALVNPPSPTQDPEGTNWQRPGRSGPAGTFTNGWTSQDMTAQVSQQQAYRLMMAALSDLIVEGRRGQAKYRDKRNINTHFSPAGPNFYLRSIQDRPYYPIRVQNTKEQPTQAFFDAILNPLDGVIIITSAWGCKAMYRITYGQDLANDDLLPRLHQWSDAAFHQWRAVHNAALLAPVAHQWVPEVGLSTYQQLMGGWLNFIAVHGIFEPEQTVQMILTCLLHHGTAQWTHIPDWNNRMTFAIGTWCFNAILATQNNRGIAWFLAQRKDPKTLGHKVFKSVTIFACDGGWPCLIWEIVTRQAVDDNDVRQAQDRWYTEGTQGYLSPITYYKLQG